MTEQFRKVEPLEIYWLWGSVEAHIALNEKEVVINGNHAAVPEARALRDWLNRALPEESTGGANG